MTNQRVPARVVVSVVLITGAVLHPLTAQTPRVAWTRQYGTGKFDQGHAVGYGEFGVYAAGDTTGAFSEQTSAGDKDAFISLHDESGNLKWIRQFGTPAEDVATGVAGDGSGAYVVGYTYGALTSRAGGADSFIRKYGPDGAVLWTRQFGSLTDDAARAVATHTSGVYVVGYVDCCGGFLPGQPPAGATDAYIRKYGGDGNELWTRQFGTLDIERAHGVAVDNTGVYVAGITTGNFAGPGGQRDGFVRKYSHEGAILWTRQFGTRLVNGDAAVDDFFAITVGPAGVFVVGATGLGAVPGTTYAGGGSDAFVIKIDTDGDTQWYRQIGTGGNDYAYGIAVGGGLVLVAGGTDGDLVNGATAGAGGEDAFLRFYDFDGNIVGTQQFGNGLNDSGRGVVAVSGAFFVAGTKNGDALQQQSLGDNDSFVLKVNAPPSVFTGGVVNAASFAPSPAPLAPGSMAVIFGADLNDGGSALSTSLGPDGKVLTSLGGTQVTVNNIPAPIFYSTPGQVSIQIPFEMAGQNIANVVVTAGGQTSLPRSINIAPAAPGFFTQNQAGTGIAAMVHEDGLTLVTRQNPAKRNEVLAFYLTGLGVLIPPIQTGEPAGANLVSTQVALAFGLLNSSVEYAGAAPGFVGVNQINARIPANIQLRGDTVVSITIGGRQANAVTIPIEP